MLLLRLALSPCSSISSPELCWPCTAQQTSRQSSKHTIILTNNAMLHKCQLSRQGDQVLGSQPIKQNLGNHQYVHDMLHRAEVAGSTLQLYVAGHSRR